MIFEDAKSKKEYLIEFVVVTLVATSVFNIIELHPQKQIEYTLSIVSLSFTVSALALALANFESVEKRVREKLGKIASYLIISGILLLPSTNWGTANGIEAFAFAFFAIPGCLTLGIGIYRLLELSDNLENIIAPEK